MTDMLEKVARVIDPEAWQAIVDGRDARADSLWTIRRTLARERAQAALTVIEETQWQPIETADKNRAVLLYSEMWEWTFGCTQIARWEGDGWLFDSEMNLDGVDDEYQPTHWRPIPAPPLSAHQQREKNDDN